jgi:hypothetical protein
MVEFQDIFVELANNIAFYKNKEATVKIISPFFKTDYLSNKNRKFLFSGFKVPDFKGSGKIVFNNEFIFISNFI